LQTQPHRRNKAKTLWRCALCGALMVFACGIYLYRVPRRPPGFYIDESSIAYNAHTISQTGRDEYGVAWPLYFRAFGEYKNPTLIYLLAIIFRFTGPSILVARVLCALFGVTTTFLLGLLAWKLSRQFSVALIVGLSAALTPWLYESSRLVFEVAAYPLAVVLFLLALQRAAAKPTWKASDILGIAGALALLTYTYSIGRLLAPMFAVGLLFFAHKGNRRAVAGTIAVYMVSLLPLVAFAFKHPGALNARFSGISYLDTNGSLLSKLARFVTQYAIDINPWTMLVTGEQNPRDHAGGMGALLLPTFVLALAGLVIVLRNLRADPWWRFIIYALVVSVIPAALTVGIFPQLRLIVFPVLLQVLMIPALSQLRWYARLRRASSLAAGKRASLPASQRISRLTLFATAFAILAQGLYFQILFHSEASSRWYFMDARFDRKILQPALAFNRKSIYLSDPPNQSGYIQALWHGALHDIPSQAFERTPTRDSIPADSIVISTEQTCENCRLLARSLNYIVYMTLPSNAAPNIFPLLPEAFRAQLSLRQMPTKTIADQKQTLRVSVKNISNSSWSCIGDAQGSYAVVVRARWRKSDGSVISDGARSELNYDVEPGDVNDVDLEVTPPSVVGNYVLEIDLVEEPDSWFSQNGSEILRVPIAVSPRQ
jgi:hypothetical protein